MYVLTEEGKKYLKKGLPEKRLIELIRDGPVEMKEATQKLGKEFSIALQWCKKYDCVEVVHGKLTLTKEPKEIEDQQNGLKDVSDDKETSIVETLISRKLVKKGGEDLLKRAEKYKGQEVTSLNTDLIKSGVWKDVKLRPYNVESPGKKMHIGKRHPYNAFLGDVRKKLVELGFQEMIGPTIELEFWNFDALYQPQNHPSRDWTQTYSLKSPKNGDLPGGALLDNVKAAHENGWTTGSIGWGYKWSPEKASRLMPRAHGTATSARTLTNCKIPGRYFSIARCYRPDVIDATHGVEFNQTEGIVVDETLNFRSLLGILKKFAIEFAGAEKVKFFPDYYPFTEPSVQMSAKHPELGWVEFCGAGVFRKELTQPLGVDVPVIAWGLGIDRLAMFKLGIKDIRDLFSQNLDLLRKQVVV